MNRLIWMAGFVVAAAISGVSCDKVKSPEPEISTPDRATNPMDKTASERKAFTHSAFWDFRIDTVEIKNHLAMLFTLDYGRCFFDGLFRRSLVVAVTRSNFIASGR